MNWQGDFDPELTGLFDNLAGPGKLYRLERHFWHELWRVPVFEAVDEDGIEVRHFGPIRVFVLADAPLVPEFNLLLRVTAPRAVADGHLGRALDWTESLGLDCRVPVRSEFGEPEAAEDHLNRRGYRQTAYMAMFVRGGSPPDLPEPPGIEVDAITEEIEGFDVYFADGDNFWAGDSFLGGLPGRRHWRTYIAVDAEKSEGMGAAAMMLHYEVAQLAFASTLAEERRRGANLALLRRQLADGLAAGAQEFFAITEESLDFPDHMSPAARNLVRAGFRLAGARAVWRPPEDLLARADEEDEDEDKPYGGGDGPDEDHDFELEL